MRVTVAPDVAARVRGASMRTARAYDEWCLRAPEGAALRDELGPAFTAGQHATTRVCPMPYGAGRMAWMCGGMLWRDDLQHASFTTLCGDHSRMAYFAGDTPLTLVNCTHAGDVPLAVLDNAAARADDARHPLACVAPLTGMARVLPLTGATQLAATAHDGAAFAALDADQHTLHLLDGARVFDALSQAPGSTIARVEHAASDNATGPAHVRARTSFRCDHSVQWANIESVLPAPGDVCCAVALQHADGSVLVAAKSREALTDASAPTVVFAVQQQAVGPTHAHTRLVWLRPRKLLHETGLALVITSDTPDDQSGRCDQDDLRLCLLRIVQDAPHDEPRGEFVDLDFVMAEQYVTCLLHAQRATSDDGTQFVVVAAASNGRMSRHIVAIDGVRDTFGNDHSVHFVKSAPTVDDLLVAVPDAVTAMPDEFVVVVAQ